MRPRTAIVFWASAAAAALLLGGTIASFEATARHPSTANDVVLALSIIALVLAFTVAGRIIVVLGRAQRQARRGEP